MFQRGSKIIITESSASKKSHPNVGDVGYLSNMYLFYLDRFILLDAIFSKYKSDKPGHPARNEHKKFIIDLGMTPKLRGHLLDAGMSKRFFLDHLHVVNLNLTGYYSPGHIVDVPRILSGDGIWSRTTNNKGTPTISQLVKINIGNIAMLSAVQNRKDVVGDRDIRAWMRTMAPIISTHTVDMPHGGEMVGTATIHNKMYDLYSSAKLFASITPCTHGVKIRLRIGFNKHRVHRIVDVFRKSQILSRMFIERIDEQYLNAIAPPTSRLIRMSWQKGIDNLHRDNIIKSKVASTHVQIVMSILFRSIFDHGDLHTKLLRVERFTPYSDSAFYALSDRLNKIRKEAICNSAALARIFDERLLKQHKPKIK